MGVGLSVSAPISGQSVATSAGTMTPIATATAALSGQSATVSAGTTTAVVDVAMSGQSATVSAGTITAPTASFQVIGRFEATDGQTTGIPNNGTLGGTWAYGVWDGEPGNFAASDTVQKFAPDLSWMLSGGVGVVSGVSYTGALNTASGRNITLMGWVYVTTAGVSGSLGEMAYFSLRKQQSSGNNGILLFILRETLSSTNFELLAVSGSTFLAPPGSGPILARDTWHHLCISADSSNNVRYFANGVLANTVSVTRTGIAAPTADPGVNIGRGVVSTTPEIYFANVVADDNFAYTADFTPPGRI